MIPNLEHHLQKKTIWILVSICIMLTACQTNDLSEYSKLKIGMEKDEVLEIMGSPRDSRPWQGQDRWDYVFYQDNIKHKKQVYFLGNKSTYIGDALTPKLSAEEQDAIFTKENREIDARWEETRKKNRNSYFKYEKIKSGNDVNSTVPKFTPVE